MTSDWYEIIFCRCGSRRGYAMLHCTNCGRSPFTGHERSIVRAHFEKTSWWKPRKLVRVETRDGKMHATEWEAWQYEHPPDPTSGKYPRAYP